MQILDNINSFLIHYLVLSDEDAKRMDVSNFSDYVFFDESQIFLLLMNRYTSGVLNSWGVNYLQVRVVIGGRDVIRGYKVSLSAISRLDLTKLMR